MTIYDFTVKDIDQKEICLENYKGKVLLIVNTATACGFTPQYEGLERLYKKYHDKGLVILDFPCNQFLEQAPGTDQELANFCQLKFGTTFETFAKIDVNGKNAAPLYNYLKEQFPDDTTNEDTAGFQEKLKELDQVRTGSEIKWNFTKFLIDKEGAVVGRYAPTVTPEELDSKISSLLS